MRLKYILRAIWRFGGVAGSSMRTRAELQGAAEPFVAGKRSLKRLEIITRTQNLYPGDWIFDRWLSFDFALFGANVMKDSTRVTRHLSGTL